MKNEAKVVSINHATASHSTTLPPSLTKVRELSALQIKKNLQELFTSADDILFEMADRATSNSEQNSMFEAMRDLRLKRKSIEHGFFQGLFDNFNQLCRVNVRRPKQDEVDIDNLSLVQNDELEESVAIETMAAKVMGSEVQALTHLSARISQLVQRKVSNEDNPLSPKSLATAFLESCTILGFEIKIKLIILKLFEKSVLDNIHTVYEDCNAHLIKEGVLPELKSTAPKRKPRTQTRTSSLEPALSDDPEGHTHIAFNELQTLLTQLKSSRSAAPPPSDAVPISTSDLMRLLSHLQQHSSDEHHTSSDIVRQQLDGILERASQKSKRTRVVGEIDNDIINLVSMLFGFILDDQSVPASLKALIGRMQIPLLKLAVLDQTFFDNAHHPARRLLNEIGSAALGWSEQDTEHRDNLYQKIESIVLRLQNDFTDNPDIFSEILTDFASFIRAERHRSELLEQRIRDAEEGRARAELARADVEKELNKRLVGKTLPELVVQILQESWSKVMLLSHLKHGEQSTQWENRLSVMDQLIWSVLPHTEPNAEQQLRSLIPKLLENLREGFNEAALDPFATSLVFTKLEVLHIQALQKAKAANEPEPVAKQPADTPAADADPVSVPEPELDSEPEPVAEEPAMVEVKAEISLTEKPAEQPQVTIEEDHPQLATVDKLNVGSWFEMTKEGEQGQRCKLAAVIKSTGRYIFVNRRGLKVLEKTRAELAIALEEGVLKQLNDAQLFDRALESVISDLRRLKERE